MKTIVLFHRLELTEMYLLMSSTLSKNFKIIHLAYGREEYELLRKHGIVEPVHIFKNEIKKLWSLSKNPKDEELKNIDRDIFNNSNEAFNLNSAIQSDRGFSLLSYEECIKLTYVYYNFWNKFIFENQVNYVLHEPTSLMMNFICAIACKKNSAEYVYQIMCGGDNGEINHLIMVGTELTSPEILRRVKEFESGEKLINFDRAKSYLKKFRKDFSIYLGKNIKSKNSLIILALISVRNKIRSIFLRNKYHKVFDNIDYWNLRNDIAGTRLKNLISYRAKINFYTPEQSDKYYYFPMHLEPEAVVLYHAHGIYQDQIKLIKNIAAQLPPMVLLYVKDHPHDFGYRATLDYLSLQQVPNIRIIKSQIPGKVLIKNSIGVITIAGTAGFEGLLMGKPVYTFANTYYSLCKRVTYIKNIRDLKNALYARHNITYKDDVELLTFVAAYLESINSGMTDYFMGRAASYGLDPNINARKLTDAFIKCFGT